MLLEGDQLLLQWWWPEYLWRRQDRFFVGLCPRGLNYRWSGLLFLRALPRARLFRQRLATIEAEVLIWSCSNRLASAHRLSAYAWRLLGRRDPDLDDRQEGCLNAFLSSQVSMLLHSQERLILPREQLRPVLDLSWKGIRLLAVVTLPLTASLVSPPYASLAMKVRPCHPVLPCCSSSILEQVLSQRNAHLSQLL